MRTSAFVPALCVAAASLCLTPHLHAQTPPAEHKVWTAVASAGLAVTSGNTDTSNINAGYDLTYDPLTRNIVKSDAMLLRGKTEGTLSADRLGLNVRDQYKLSARAYVYGQNQYLRDTFKNIDYLLAPTGGLGFKVYDTPETKLDADAGLGGVWEKNPGADVRASGALTAGEKLAQKLTATTALTQSVVALWKTQDLADSLYTFSIGVSASMSTRTQLKVEFLDTYKNKPPAIGVQKNDLATLLALVYKL